MSPNIFSEDYVDVALCRDTVFLVPSTVGYLFVVKDASGSYLMKRTQFKIRIRLVFELVVLLIYADHI